MTQHDIWIAAVRAQYPRVFTSPERDALGFKVQVESRNGFWRNTTRRVYTSRRPSQLPARKAARP